jgi:hypothetical protein
LQNKRKEKLLQLQNQQQQQQQPQQQQQQQQQEQNVPFLATTGKRKNDSENQASEFVTLDMQQPNSVANHHEQITASGIPLQTLQDGP